MPRPVVGVSACVRDLNTVLNYHAANARYMDAVHDVSGAMPIIIPALGDHVDRKSVV